MFISLSSQTTLQFDTNFLAFSLADASAPDTILEVQPGGPKPYGNPLQISFDYNCISAHIYVIKIWETPSDGTAEGVVRNSWSQAVNAQNILIREPIYLKVGISPGLVAGTTTYVDTTWLNWDYIMRRASVTTVPDKPGNPSPDYHQEETGGITLILPGDKFYDESIVIEFVPQVVPGDNGVPSNSFGTGQVITADITLSNAYCNQALIFQSATNSIIVKLPPISTVSNFNQWFYFFSQGGNHKNAVFIADTTEKFLYGGDKTSLILGQAESMIVFRGPTGPAGANRWNIVNDLVGVRTVGEIFYSHISSELNSILCDGQLLLRTDYPRLWAYVQSLGGAVVTDTAWNAFTTVDDITFYPNKGFFSSGDSSTTFRLPLLTDIMLKGTASSAGALEKHQFPNHQHEETIGNLATALFGRGIVSRLMGDYTSYSPKVSDLTGPPISSGGELITLVGDEVRVNSRLLYPMIRF